MARRKRVRVLQAALGLLAFVLIVSVSADSCVHRHRNEPLAEHDADGGYRFRLDGDRGDNSNGLFVALTLSGGGTRAAALGYGVLRALRDTEVEWPAGSGRRVPLLEEVDVISSVSGGSFPAAYYGLFGDRLFDDFEERFLRRDFQTELALNAGHPRNLFRLASAHFDRADLAAEVFGREVFEDRTFAEMSTRPGAPFVVLNATNLNYGTQFWFTQEAFDYLGSDLSVFPVGRAVAASAAFPFLLSPISLENHARPAGFEPPTWVRTALEFPADNARQHAIAKALAPYHDAKDEHPYVHLMDGGLSDNLGLRFLYHGYHQAPIATLLQSDPVLGGRHVEPIERIVVIVVNARTDPPSTIDQSSSSPTETAVALKTATVSMENYTFETVERVRELLLDRQQTSDTITQINATLEREGVDYRLPELPRLRAHLIHITLESIPDPDERARFLSLPTSFSLTDEDVDALIAQAARLFAESPEAAELVGELGGG